MGRRLGEFDVARELGRGGALVGYKAVRRSLGRLVTMLIFEAGGLARFGPARPSEFALKRFLLRSSRPKRASRPPQLAEVRRTAGDGADARCEPVRTCVGGSHPPGQPGFQAGPRLGPTRPVTSLRMNTPQPAPTVATTSVNAAR